MRLLATSLRHALTLAVLLIMGVVRAQETTPPDITAARNLLLTQALADSQRITEQYVLALSAREAALAAAGDYEEAKHFQQRRAQLQSLYFGSTVDSHAIVLPLTAARLVGSIQASGDILSNWRSNGSGAEWSQFKLTPGRYHLEFEANMIDAPVAFASAKMQPQEKASFTFAEVTQLISTGTNTATFEITQSADETTFIPVRTGPLTFTRSPITLRLVANSGYPANLIRLRNLRLVPVTETATVSAPIEAAAALKTVRDDLAAELLVSQKRAIDDYRNTLSALTTSKPALKEAITAEAQRLDRLTTRRQSTPLLSPPAAFATATSSLQDFDILTGAMLADGPPAAGDRFKVIHDGKTIAVRLLWVASPPPESDTKSIPQLAKHFGIESAAAVSIGRLARDFTDQYLRSKPLRLLAYPQPDRDGTLAVLVVLQDIGLYQNVLIDQGLAAVQPPPSVNKAAITENALLSSLIAREEAIRKRSSPPGAWALRTEAK